MKLVIDIPDEEYERIQALDWKNSSRWYSPVSNAIHNGTLLPKGHGDLIDRSELKEHLYACETNGRPLYVMELHERLAVIDEVDAIIEADKKGRQG